MLREQVKQVRSAQHSLSGLPAETRNHVLSCIGELLQREKERIFQAQETDVRKAKQDGLAEPLVKRLVLNQDKLDTLCRGIDDLIRLKDPIGRRLSARELDEGLTLYQETCPIGVIGMVFESRPDALVQIASLCLKSGNGIVLKGGSEALETNRVLTECIQTASKEAGITDQWICLLETRDEVTQMLSLDDLIDLLIPRGSNSFVRYIMDHTKIPVLGHADGICHIYVDADADMIKTVSVCVDAKCQYPAVCNAVETILVHQQAAEAVIPQLVQALREEGVEVRGDERTSAAAACRQASEEDWGTEYLDLIVSIKVVDSMDEAVEHIHRYGSGHTDAIITEDEQTAGEFMERVDSAGVFWNCSTRFSDGYRYGLGAEVGISTLKVHARGPVGLEGLVSYKWKLYGSGHISADYTGQHARQFTHRELDT